MAGTTLRPSSSSSSLIPHTPTLASTPSSAHHFNSPLSQDPAQVVGYHGVQQHTYPIVPSSKDCNNTHFLYPPSLPLSFTHNHPGRSRPSHIRSLTILNAPPTIHEDMALEDPPSSPPELSSSRSSDQSSSRNSSTLPYDNSHTTDFSHFEDISLSDMYQTSPPQHAPRPNKPRPLLRTNQSAPQPRTSRSASNLRDISNGLRTSVAINNHVRAIEAQRSPYRPNGHPLPSHLSIPSRPTRNHPGARRLSPPSPNQPISPRLLRSQTDQPTYPRPRKSLTQTPRKTTKELEAEYNDEDDELPDDAFIMNIPISPRPLHERSRSTSPESHALDSRSKSVIGIEASRPHSWDEALSDLSIEARDLTYKLESHADALIRRHSADQSATETPIKTLPLQPVRTMPLPPMQRGDVLVDPLPASKEKEKHLTRTRPSWLPPKSQKEERKHLKEYQKMMHSFAENERRRSAGVEKSEHGSPKQSRDADSALRAWRHVLGDWDAALQRPQTRELWWQGVPPALRGQVWARAVGNDLQLSAASFKAALARAKVSEQRLASTFTGGPQRAHSRQVSAAESRADQRARKSLKTLDSDISDNAFPALGLFQEGRSRHRALRDLLLAYASYREDTGHVRGTAAIAALLLLQSLPSHSASAKSPPSPTSRSKASLPASLNIDSTTHQESSTPPTSVTHKPSVEDAAAATAFITLANLLNRPLSLSFCINDIPAKDRTYRHISNAVQHKLPRLHEHFAALIAASASLPNQPQLGWNDLLSPMCLSLLTSHMGVEEAARVWDVLVLEGDGVVIRGVVGALARLEAGLYGGSEEVLGALGWASSRAGPASESTASAGEAGVNSSRKSTWKACTPDEAIEWVRWAGREEDPKPGTAGAATGAGAKTTGRR